MNEAFILEVKGNSLDDGPGIRTVVFFKGCPLDCIWCHNPESKKPKIELGFDQEKCIGCHTCVAACPEKALSKDNQLFVDRGRCSLCLECVDVCPANALKRVGAHRTAEGIMEEIRKDLPFMKASGGGVTLSGGEPTLFMEFASRLLRDVKAQGVNTLVETCGLFSYEKFIAHLYPHIDIVYFDLKIFDSNSHEKYCGKSNEIVLKNFESLSRQCERDGVQLLPRIPLVPGITATRENLSAIASFLKGQGVLRVELLAYNPTWTSKTSMLGTSHGAGSFASMDEWMPLSRVEECREIFKGFDVR